MLYLVATILAVSCVYGADYCAWNRAATPINANNAETYNWINGEYSRSTSESSGGQSLLWHGMPYYSSSNGEDCFQSTLWMYRYTDSQEYPPTYTWVIAASLGTLPVNGYAYCGPDETPSISDLSSPLLCDGKWKVGKPLDNTNGQVAAQETDVFFKVMEGGCPQINCNELKFCTTNNEDWGSDEDIGSGYTCTTYAYNKPNFYRASSSTSETGYYHLFFNANVWRWAISESITTLDPDNCELYKFGKGFTAVSNVNGGSLDDIDTYTPWYQSAPVPGTNANWYDDLTIASRLILCEAIISTPSSPPTPAPLATAAPTDVDLCNYIVPKLGVGAQIPATWGCGTPSPVDNSIDTPVPTPAPLPTITRNTPEPTTGFPTQTPAPVAIPATPPAKVGTLPPTKTNFPTTSSQKGSPRPTFPTLSPAFNAPVYIPARSPNAPIGPPAMFGTTPSGSYGGSGNSANTINCNVAYLLCVVMALYKLLF